MMSWETYTAPTNSSTVDEMSENCILGYVCIKVIKYDDVGECVCVITASVE